MSARSGRSAKSPFRIALVSSETEAPVKGGAAVSSSYRITPSAQTSDCASTSSAESCSGDMYAGVPMKASVAVSGVSSPRVAFAIPKSSTLTMGVPSNVLVRKRFDGFRSRWTMPSL